MTTNRERKLFRMPSGALIRSQSLLPVVCKRVSAAEAVYVLGARLRHIDTQVGIENTQIVRWIQISEEMAEGIQRAIGSRFPVVSFTPEDMRFRFGDFAPFAQGQPVVLVTDGLLTGRTASNILRVIRRMEATPVAVATILDGRVDRGAPLRTFAGPVPVVCCVQRKVVETGQGLEVENVNPARGGVSSGRPEIERPISSDRFLSWLRNDEESGIFLGHIDRGRARHFSTYLNVGRLVATNPEAIEAVVGNIRQSLEPFDPTETVRIIYPATEGDFARRLAQAARASLEKTIKVQVELVAAMHAPESDWRLEGVGWSRRFTAVIIDWGAVTASTLRALMSLAARSGSSRIHVIALTSQLDEEAEWQLRTIVSVHEPWQPTTDDEGMLPFGYAQAPTPLDIEVPVSTALLCRVPMGMAASSDCHLCHLTKQLLHDMSEAPVGLVREHALRKYDLYKPRSRREILRRPASDLGGGSLSADDSANVWNAHQLLEDARTSTARREDVRREISRWTISDRDSITEAWIRLLVVEGYWLDEPPLNDEDIRTIVAHTCVNILLSRSGSVAIGEIQVQAAIVLRAASKRVFVERFGELIEAALFDEVVAAELCYAMYTLIRRPYNHSPSIMRQVLAALLDARDRLIIKQKSDISSKDTLFAVNSLYREALETHNRGSLPTDALFAWHALQTSYVLPMITHTRALTSMLVVLDAISGPVARTAGESSQTAAQWFAVLDAWEECWDFLASAVFPYLHVLRDLFEASIPSLASASEISVLSFDGGRAERFASELAALARRPELFKPGLRRDLEFEAFAWFDAFLRGSEISSTKSLVPAVGGSHLLRLMAENPCDLAGTWNIAFERMTSAGRKVARVIGMIPRGTLVFCSRPILVELLSQVIENAAGLRHKKDGRPGNGVTIGIDLNKDSRYVNLRIINDWSEAEELRQGGLSLIANELSAFGAQLTHQKFVSKGLDEAILASEWTYEVVLRVRRWEAGSE